MAKRRRIGKKELADAWKDLRVSDRRFFGALFILIQALRDENFRRLEAPAPLRRSLHKLDRNTVYSVVAECMHLLLDAPELVRVKKGPHGRTAKKSLSAAKKKSRTKKPAPKRLSTRKGPPK